ncbi:MAG: hypothetical protein IKD93_02545 [Firmicutes bacterium]|nr:hypothetical protein [Bacillota bacterium]
MGLSKHYIMFDGTNSQDFGAYLFAKQILGAPARRRETVEVPGKSGALIIDGKTYENTLTRYTVIFDHDAKTGIRDFGNFLLARGGYARLEDTFHPDEYYTACVSGELEPVISTDETLVKAEITFERLPQRWLKIGEEVKEFTAAGVLQNPTRLEARPLIRVYGNGQVAVNSQTFTVSNNAGTYMDVDCEEQDAFTGSTNRNGDIVLANQEFPVLTEGANTISLSGPSAVEITPRWWQL